MICLNHRCLPIYIFSQFLNQRPCNGFGRLLVVVSFRCYPLETPGKFQPSGVLLFMFLSFSFVSRLFMSLYLFLGVEEITDADGIKLLSIDTLISVNRTASETMEVV